eukprot:6869649-Pyramimonas_sp.AAC.1
MLGITHVPTDSHSWYFRAQTHTHTHTRCEDVSGEALVLALPRGGARRYITGPFAPNWGMSLAVR